MSTPIQKVATTTREGIERPDDETSGGEFCSVLSAFTFLFLPSPISIVPRYF
jgi:hypothetical protein